MSAAASLNKKQIYKIFPEVQARYCLVGNKPIGHASGFGAVWKAKDEWLSVDVAIKISDSDLASEIKFCRDIDKETVRVFEYYKSEEGWQAYVMELLASPWMSLSSLIGNRKYKENDIKHYFDSFEIVRGLLRGLTSIHGANYSNKGRFIHSDIKPDNLFVRIEPKKKPNTVFRMPAPEELVKIIDLGITVERGNILMGSTWAYTPPDAQFGEPGVDLYAVAVCFLELLTGECPDHDVMAHKSRIEGFLSKYSSGSDFINRIAVNFAVLAKNAVTQRGITVKTLLKFLDKNIFDLYPLMLLSAQSLVKKGNNPMLKSDMADALFPVFATYFCWNNNTQNRRIEIAEYLSYWRKFGIIIKIDGTNKYCV